MAQGNGLQLFPILFRGMRVELLPTGLRQLLSSTTCIPFAHPKTDAQSMIRMKQHMRGAFEASTGVVEASSLTEAKVPTTVPELPDVMSERPEMLTELRGHLLGLETGKISLSSVKKSKLSTHGQGGVGKTTMAAAIVNDPVVRGHFDRIGWVSGQQT